MSDKKQFSPRDLAVKILENVYEQIKKSEIMAKSKNTAHEIDAGGEPSNDEAECPESLEAADFSGESSNNNGEAPKKKKKQAPAKAESESEESESEESESEESESEESQIEKNEDPEMISDSKPNAPTHINRRGEKAGKSKALTPAQRASGWGQAVKPGQKTTNVGQFNRIKEVRDSKKQKMEKADNDKINPSFDREKKDVEWTKPQTTMINATKPGSIKSNRGDQKKFVEDAKKRREKFRQEGALKSEGGKKSEDKKKEDQPLQDCGAPMDKSSDNKVKETKGIDLDKKKKADKDMENFKRPLEKCGDVEKVGKSDSCGIKKSEKGVEKLKKFLGK
jgi:hypothetical protein